MIVTVSVVVQPAASVIVHTYVPAFMLVRSADVACPVTSPPLEAAQE